MLGYDSVGDGPQRAVVLNDWLCDTSTWDDARKYLDVAHFTYVFADLRGYGRSKSQRGELTVREAATDVLSLVDLLGWTRFSVIGHSMSSLVALHLAQQSERVDRAVVLCPPPVRSFGVDDETLASMQALGRGSDEQRGASLRTQWGTRLSEGWIRLKLQRWRDTSDGEAVAGYVAMFARDGMPDPTTQITRPVLAITGEQDWEMMRRAAAMSSLSPLCANLDVVGLADAGHYPMQECPPMVVSVVERFLVQTLA